MFESLVVTTRERTPLRRWLSLPVALSLHLALGASYLAAGLYGHDTVLPPAPKDLFAPPSLPVVFVNRSELERRDAGPKREAKAASAQPLLAPADTPDQVLPAAEPAGSPATPADPGDGMVVPTDGEPATPAAVGAVPTLRAGDVLHPPKLLQMVRPEYPSVLRSMGVTGRVVLEVVVDETGAVAEVRVLQSSNPLFAEAAERAVRQWRYTRPLSPGGGQCRVSLLVPLRFTTS